MLEIRQEQPEDHQAIRLVNDRAFGRPEEADIVETLRARCPDLLSLVAEVEGRIVGHVLFSPATIEGSGGVRHGMGLAPMAVLPEFQRQGIGSSLARTGLEMLRAGGCPFVIVLGHPDYYPRFGFEPASRYGICSPWPDIPAEAFLVLFFGDPPASDVSGTARYRPEFDEAV